MKHITLVMPYYRNPSMLAHHYSLWKDYAQTTKSFFDVVIVDDGSPDERAFDVPRPEGLPELSIYRVLEDRPWHQHGARNLGAHVATGPWLFLTDMDHVVPEATFQRLMHIKRKNVYTFDRLDAPNMTVTRDRNGRAKPHPNTFVMTREVYWEVGGYDEDFCGLYGTDGLFRSRLFQRHQRTHLSGVEVVRYPREVIPDASTRDVTRKEGRPEGAKEARLRAKQARGHGDQITVLDFPWERQL